MKRFLLILVSLAISFISSGVFAQEDAEDFVFEGDTFDTEGETSDLQENQNAENQEAVTTETSLPPPPTSSQASTPDAENKALTDVIKQDKEAEKPDIPLAGKGDTWVGKIVKSSSSIGSSEDKSLEDMVQDVKNMRDNSSRRSNVSVFDISGLMLRMNLKQADSTMKNRGFKKIMQKYQIPNFIKWRNEEYCRNSGVVGYERIESCIAQKAKKDNHQYVQEAKYIKYDTKEEISIMLSSNFTDNKIYKITYKSQAANVRGSSPKAMYLRNIKVYDFWKKINHKYGEPDDKENVTWGLGGNKPFMRASTGYLSMEDPMLRELDYTRMSREDQRYMNTDLYSF